MKKIIRKSCVYLMAACVLISAPSHAYAENSTTEVQVEFKAGTGPTYPVNPEDPNIESETGEVTGSLAIVSVSDFGFGEITVTSGAGLYDITTTQPNIQVVDLRGTGVGWKVTASVSNFTSGGSASLPGASIHIYKGRTNSLSSSTAPVQVTDLELTTDGELATVITAQSGAGTGLWVMRWYPAIAQVPEEQEPAYIQLEVPAGSATVGNHMATINWTLGNTP